MASEQRVGGVFFFIKEKKMLFFFTRIVFKQYKEESGRKWGARLLQPRHRGSVSVCFQTSLRPYAQENSSASARMASHTLLTGVYKENKREEMGRSFLAKGTCGMEWGGHATCQDPRGAECSWIVGTGDRP